jgi:ribose 5-phosphate isomerase B
MREKNMRIVIANDHGAVALKKNILEYLEKNNHTVVNLGVDDENSCDYPDMALLAANEFKKGGYDFGILMCGTGIGISIAANKIDGIRCAVPQNIFAAKMARAHNNANFIAFGGRIIYPEPVTEMIDAFIDSEFEGGRHQVRVDKIMALEKNKNK